jgi:hypothetical protein
MWIKCEMYTGRIVTDKTLNSKAEAVVENQNLMNDKSKFRWIQSLRELGQWEEVTDIGMDDKASEVMARICE